MVYSGQFDVIVAAPLTNAFLNHLDWKGHDAFESAERKVWKVKSTDTEVAGFVKSVSGSEELPPFYWVNWLTVPTVYCN